MGRGATSDPTRDGGPMPPAAHQPRPAGALTLATTLLGVRRPRRLRACRPHSYGGGRHSYGGASFPARCACRLATARLTTFQVTSPGDDLRRPRLSSKASLERRPVHTRRLRRMAGRQPPIATPRAVRELQQHQQHGLFHLRPKSTWGGNGRTLRIQEPLRPSPDSFTPSGCSAACSFNGMQS